MIKIKYEKFDEIKNEYIDEIGHKVHKKLTSINESSILIKYIDSHLTQILVGKKEELDKIIQEILNLYHLDYDILCQIEALLKKRFHLSNTNKIDFFMNVGKSIDSKNDIFSFLENYYMNYLQYIHDKKLVRDIFDYDQYISKTKWRLRIAESTNIKVCPYCNHHSLTLLSHKNKKISGADLDHYYSKELFPYLALSLYNLVPACSLCNSKLKKNRDFYKYPHIYPYEEEFGNDARFILKRDKLYFGDEQEFKVEIINHAKGMKFEKIKNSCETFKLNAIYEDRVDEIAQVIKMIRVFQSNFFKDIADILDCHYSILENEILEFVTLDDVENIVNGKLKKDLYEQYSGIKED